MQMCAKQEFISQLQLGGYTGLLFMYDFLQTVYKCPEATTYSVGPRFLNLDITLKFAYALYQMLENKSI